MQMKKEANRKIRRTSMIKVNLDKLILDKGLSVGDLADKIDMQYVTAIKMFERGTCKPKTLKEIRKALRISEKTMKENYL